MNDRHIKSAIQDCIHYAYLTEQPIHATFEFVRKLVNEQGWSEVDARTVGAQAIAMIETCEKVSN